MLIRKQGRLVKLVRVESSTGSARAARTPQRRRGKRHVLGSFRVEEPVPAALLDMLTREERRTLTCWMAVYREEEARARALPVLAGAPEQFDTIIAALEAAADTLSVEEADCLWAQLKVIARTLTRAGHMRPRAPRRPPPSPPGQRDFFGNFEEIHQSDAQRECTDLG
ncbi:hypothetical protein [Burkholderia ambifaria]|uniref:hypothetical protein n=1 Tax=Burkholderia ambifaria TaxID=152480 RepID=UPI000680BEAD|nr:hypothetical protein [Burkholderia ambifaria]